jgi:hypothetical protein
VDAALDGAAVQKKLRFFPAMEGTFRSPENHRVQIQPPLRSRWLLPATASSSPQLESDDARENPAVDIFVLHGTLSSLPQPQRSSIGLHGINDA